MARTASGSEVLEQAQQALREARTVEELRQAQAVGLPLLLGISIEQTAESSHPIGCILRAIHQRSGGGKKGCPENYLSCRPAPGAG